MSPDKGGIWPYQKMLRLSGRNFFIRFSPVTFVIIDTKLIELSRQISVLCITGNNRDYFK